MIKHFLEFLIAASVRQRGVVVVLTALFALWGAWSLSKLKLDAFPDLTNVQVQVVTASAGMSSLEVEQLITVPIERALGGVPGVTELRSLSRTGISAVTVVFEDGTPLWQARQLVQARVTDAREQIPASAGAPELGPPSTGLGEVYQFTVRSDRHSLPQLYRIFERDIAPRLRSVPGVVEVNAWGGGRPQLEVRLDPMRMAALNLGVDQVAMALEAGLGRATGGALVEGDEQILVRAVSNPTTTDALAQLPLRFQDGALLRVDQLGQVREGGALTVGMGSVDASGEALFAMVQLLAGADALAAVELIKARMPVIEAALPQGVEIKLVYSRDKLVKNTLGTVERSLLEGGLLVILVLFVLLGDVRAGLIVSSVIPLSMLGAFGVMHALGYSGNLMSLGAIDFGLIVDGSIVITESVVALEVARRSSLAQAVTERAQRVAVPVVFAVGVLILVYLPIMALWGTEGKLFRPMALTVLAALATALVLSLTFVPAVASWFIVPRGEHQTMLMRAGLRLYEPMLSMSMRRPKALILVVMAMMAASFALVSRLGLEFVPRLQEGDLVVQTTRLPSISPEAALAGATRIEAALRTLPEVEVVASRTGAPAVATDPMGLEQADILVRLKPREQWREGLTTEQLVAQMNTLLERVSPDAQVNFTQPIEMRFNELLEGITGDVGVKIYGPDLDVLLSLAQKVGAQLDATEGSADLAMPALEGVPSYEVKLDAAKLARYGLTPAELMPLIESLQRGVKAGEVIRDQFRDPVIVLIDPLKRPQLQALPVILPSGESVPLSSLATIELSQTPAAITRHQGSRRVVVVSNVRGRDVGSFVQDAQRRIGALELPPGYWIEWGGKYEQLQAAARQMAILVPLVLLAIIGLVYAAFGRWKPTLLILSNVPVALSGGLVALWLRQLPLSISAVVGCIALFGVAVMNGIVMLSRTQELHGEAGSGGAFDAALLSARERLRPVVTTALVAGLGFVPMALATGVGAEVQRPLATVVIGGLISSTTLTLLVLPTLYALVYRGADRRGHGLKSAVQEPDDGVDGGVSKQEA